VGIVAKVALPAKGGPVAPVERIIVAEGERTEIIAESGRIAAGTNGRLFRSFSDPVSNTSVENGAIAFFATLQQTHGSNSRSLQRGIWWQRVGANATLHVLSRTGDPAPGCDGMLFADFRSIAMLPDGGPIFSARIGRTGVPRDDNEVGLWATDRAGKLILIFRQGDSLPEPGNGGNRVVKGFDVFRVNRGAVGVDGSFGKPNEIAIRAYFTDGTSGIIQTTIP
jgi:hypothetical protein